MPPASTTGYAYEELRGALLGGRLLPNQRLVEKDLVDLLGVNRAAVREALARLEQEGLVERRANRGVTVRDISPQESHDVLEMRMAIESLAVRWACERRTEEQSARLRQLLSELKARTSGSDVIGFAERQAEIHHQILAMAHSAILSGTVKSLSAQTARIRRRSLATPGRLEVSLAEHERIVEAILLGDAPMAEAEMTLHLKHVQKLVIWD